MPIIEKIKQVVFKYKQVKIDKIYKELPEYNKDVIRGTINRYISRDDKEFERVQRGTYKVINNKEESIDEEIVVYHVSLDIDNGEKMFIPAVPKHRCKKEDDKIKRICVSRTIKDAISGFPYKDFFVNTYKTYHKDVFSKDGERLLDRYLTVYEFKVNKKDLIFSEDLKEYVPDVHLTNECWLMKDSLGIGRVINVREVTLNCYNSYANYYFGVVDKLEYEESISDEVTTVSTITTSNAQLDELLHYIKENNLNYKIHASGKNPFYYFDMGSVVGETTEVYEWSDITIEIPVGFCKGNLWKIVAKIDRSYVETKGYHYKIEENENEDEDEKTEERLLFNIEYILETVFEDKYGDNFSTASNNSLKYKVFNFVKDKLYYNSGYEYTFHELENLISEIV